MYTPASARVLTIHPATTRIASQRGSPEALAAEREQMQTRLLIAERTSSLATLAAGVAHEINNPLACLMTSLELVRGRLPELEWAEPSRAHENGAWLRLQLERALEGAERVRVVVRGLKSISRADDETLSVVDPRRALDTSITLATNEIRHRAVLVRDYHALPVVWANEARLGQVFLNLLLNATQAIAAGDAAHHEIRVFGRTDAGGRAVIEVHDTGCGIDADDLARIFEPFFTTKPQNSGTGLGLALCHAVVSSLEGEITVASAPGRGSIFRVTLPAAEGGPLSAAPPGVAPMAANLDPRGHVLFVDDEPDMCELMAETLAPFHDMVTTTDARKALALVAGGQRFDVIFCDIRMPNMTGLDFHSRLRVDNPSQANRVVLMSGGFTRRPGEAPIVLPRPLLEKPFGVQKVLSLVREAMRREPLNGQPRVSEDRS